LEEQAAPPVDTSLSYSLTLIVYTAFLPQAAETRRKIIYLPSLPSHLITTTTTTTNPHHQGKCSQPSTKPWPHHHDDETTSLRPPKASRPQKSARGNRPPQHPPRRLQPPQQKPAPPIALVVPLQHPPPRASGPQSRWELGCGPARGRRLVERHHRPALLRVCRLRTAMAGLIRLIFEQVLLAACCR
jgi:hypothetical protein